MLFGSLHAKMMEDEKKASPIDGRKFNRRSRAKMNREASAISNSIKKAEKKKVSRRGLYNGVFSEEEIRQGEEDKKRFQEEMKKKKELRELKAQKECRDELTKEPSEAATGTP